MNIDIEGGKYTFVQRPGGGCEFLRHGEPWHEIGAGAKPIIAMACELEEARKLTALERIARGTSWAMADALKDFAKVLDECGETLAASMARASAAVHEEKAASLVAHREGEE